SPSTAEDAVLDCLNARELIAFSRTSKSLHRVVLGYLLRAYSIFAILEPFFTAAQTNQFRIIQAFTGLLISGSTALQLFIRRSRCDPRFSTSDLDLYVEHRYSSIVGKFLIWCQYEFVDHPDFDVAVAEGARKMRGYPNHDYPDGRGFAGVYNFVKAGMKIQLITACNSALDIILNFHSTIVMNVISHSHAYSLYP
ncbi:hypothetical protein BDP27DRAFT_1232871, partial [Rhodocollybia butyracea]